MHSAQGQREGCSIVNGARHWNDGQQGMSVEKLLYFFLGVRKNDVRQRVGRLKARYPDESAAELAARVVAAQRPLSLLGGALLKLPALLPASAAPLKLLGVAGATSALAHMHMSMVLEIALIHGFDIDEKARLKEMAVVFAGVGLMSASPGLGRARGLGMFLSLATGTMMVSSISELIGQSAIAYYQRLPQVPRLRAVNDGRSDIRSPSNVGVVA